MKRMFAVAVTGVMAATIGFVADSVAVVQADSHIDHTEGRLVDGTRYEFDWPEDWNGVAFVDLDYAGSNRAESNWLLANGFAVGGTERLTVGYRYANAAGNMVETLRAFEDAAGKTADTAIVWGRSRGGFVARKSLELYPDVFDGGLAACGGGNGAIATFNQKLDAKYALKLLLDVDEIDDLALSDITDSSGVNSPFYQQSLLGRIVQRAMATPEGQARLALAASFSQVQPWSDASLPRPGDSDWDGQIENIGSVFAFGHPAVVSGPIEQLAGGTVFWNAGVDYRELFAQSDRKPFVRAMYERAGLDVSDDLDVLQAGDRVEADPAAVDFMEYHSTYTGAIEDPILTLHTIGDPADPLPMERGYTDTVRKAGNNRLLRQAVVDRPGHCNFRPVEVVAGLMTLLDRVEAPSWGSTTDATSLNQRALEILDTTDIELGEPDFVTVELPHPLRTWDGSNW